MWNISWVVTRMPRGGRTALRWRRTVELGQGVANCLEGWSPAASPPPLADRPATWAPAAASRGVRPQRVELHVLADPVESVALLLSHVAAPHSSEGSELDRQVGRPVVPDAVGLAQPPRRRVPIAHAQRSQYVGDQERLGTATCVRRSGCSGRAVGTHACSQHIGHRRARHSGPPKRGRGQARSILEQNFNFLRREMVP